MSAVYCHECGRVLDEKEAVWLELDAVDGSWHEEGEVEPERSQGGFPFGKDCARRKRNRGEW